VRLMHTPLRSRNDGERPAVENSDSDVEYSPRLPESWEPLEYEMLEYADSLPRRFAERVRFELEVQSETVAQLRGEHAELRQACKDKGSSADAFDEVKPHLLASPCGAATPCSTAAPTTPTRAITKCSAEAQWRSPCAVRARKMESKTHQVLESADEELVQLSKRERHAKEQQRLLACEATEDEAARRKLREVEGDLLRMHCRVQQLERARRHADHRVSQREEEERRIASDLEHLRAEVRSFRAKVPDFERLEQLEEKLRNELREAKNALRTKQMSMASDSAKDLRFTTPSRSRASTPCSAKSYPPRPPLK